MKERFTLAAAVMLLLTRRGDGGEEILLQRRQGTGYRDGYFDLCAAGHVEAGEPLRRAMAREAKEELGIEIGPDELRFVCLIHKLSGGEEYMNAYFTAQSYRGEPTVCEPTKCGGIGWYPIDALPAPMVEDRILALENYRRGISYGEYGWGEE